MSALTWLDQKDRELPRANGGVQYIRLLGGYCGLLDLRLAVSPPDSTDSVSLLGDRVETLEQVRPGLFARTPRADSRSKFDAGSFSAAGEIVAVAFLDGAEVARSRLKVLPANFTDLEYRQMLLEIGLAAVSSASWVQAPVSAQGVSTAKAGSTTGLKAGYAHATFATLEACVDEIREAMTEIVRHPLQDVRATSTVMPVSRVLGRPRAVQAFVKRPGRRTVTLDIPSESLDCPENQYLRWAFERVLLPLARLERIRVSEGHGGRDEELERLFFGAAKRNERLQDLAARIREAGDQTPHEESRARSLDRIEGQIEEWCRTLPVEASSPVAVRPFPTERMLGTPGYRTVFQAMERIETNLGGTAHKGLAIADAVLRREVKATWRCYETWCVVQTLRAFAEIGGFRTPEGEQTLGELLEIVDHEVQIPRGIPIVLARSTELIVEIVYEPQLPSSRDRGGRSTDSVHELKPDILVTIRRGRSARKHFILDAKYRDYAKQGLSQVAHDLCVTALLKYRDGISTAASPDAKKISGSYILHSDPAGRHAKNDFWGGVPAESWLPHDAVADLPDGWQGTWGHACGLIRLRPDRERDFQLGRLLDMFLQYLVPKQGFECPRCGEVLAIGTDVRLERKGNIKDVEHEVNYIRKALRKRWGFTSLVCVCPACSNLWFENHCQEYGHPLFKQGRRSYHEASRHQWSTPGMYICPTCGDDPEPGSARARRSSPTQNEEPPFGLDEDDCDYGFDDIPF